MTAQVGALDGGGSKSASALADRAGRVVRLPDRAGTNPQDGPGWAAELSAALAPLAAAGVEGAVLGLAGRGEVAAQDAAVSALVARHLGPGAACLNDVELAARAAFPGGGGVLVLAGTGSMAWASGPAGQARAGGWGDLIGDEGSAYRIGEEALQIAAGALDGRSEARDFAAALLARLPLPDPDHAFALIGWLAGLAAPRAAIAAVAREVDALSEAGDEIAAGILVRAAGHLARAAEAAARRAGLAPGWPWAPGGSVFLSRRFRSALAARLGPPVAPALSPLAGGLLLAARQAGWAPDTAWQGRVAAALPVPSFFWPEISHGGPGV